MTTEPRPVLSVIIPAYNEEARIARSLVAAADHLATLPGPAEMIIVDDGSRDGTAAAVEAFAAAAAPRLAVRLLRNGRNRGKGYSLKHGVLLSRGVYLLLSDADFSTPIEELPRLLRQVREEGCGIAIGSRALPESRIEVRQPAWRETMGKCFNLLVRALTRLPFVDTQCGFKVMRRSQVVPLFRAARVERFAYDVEILYLARKAGVKVVEVPVTWRNAAGSKVSPVRDSLDMLLDIVRVVLRDRRGGYGAPERLAPEPAEGER
jgi:dolichyl-phosphate beta-glucosyltransferase